MAKLEAATMENAGDVMSRIKATFEPPESVEQPTQEAPESTPDEVEFQETEAQAEESEALEAESESEESTDNPDEPPTYKVKVNGEEHDVTIEDLQKGYMMETDYRHKTAQTAELRKDLESKVESLTSLIQDGEAVLALELEALDSPEMLELKEDDPKAYYEKREKVQAQTEKLAQLKKAREARTNEAWQQRVSKETEALKASLPSWLDEAAAKADLSMINDLWTDYGFTEQDLGQFVDHRLILISREAALYRKLKNAKPESKKVKQPPKSTKPGSNQTEGRRSNTPAMQRREALKKSGKLADATAAINDLINT